MQLTLKRRTFTDNSTIGDLSIDGVWQCLTLEDKVRPTKVAGKTAIPPGVYTVVFDYSQRVQRETLHVLAVPEFEGIRIHAGNTAANTEGCILVGYVEDKDWIGASRSALKHLEARCKAAPGTITLTIQ